MVNRAFRSTGYFIEYLALLLSILSVWTVMARQGHLNTIILPAPNSILETIIDLVADGALFTNMFISVSRVLQGYFLAALLGISLGILIGLSKHLDRITELIIQMIKPIPPIAWIPLVILWFGIGESGKVFLIFLGGFFTILINVVDGIHQTDPKLVEVSRSMETPFWKHIALMVIPGAAPNIFTGLRTGLSSCWMCVVAAELVSSTTGLGYLIMDARQFGQTDIVIVGMLTIGIVGKLMDSLLRFVEKKTLRWI
ncbi:Alkanesulfonates transport system permease protein [Anaerovibrio sp. JC8]|uniref:ABC transporter permease n=1 Tax=Anaerovibrio sp. JC8 TaxID=1240085 RepID=UPI000A0BE1CB|nr:ABC transporter permease [Anaerovibrio sp. JC8]ORT99126.1 Alkanesulfonates transport system permease protein [Anaerovibrio sp. JC8]